MHVQNERPPFSFPVTLSLDCFGMREMKRSLNKLATFRTTELKGDRVLLG